MNVTRTLAFIALVAATTLIPMPAAEARVRVRAHGHAHIGVWAWPATGWYGGIGLVGNSILDQAGGSEQLESGFGFTLYGGLHVNERLSLEAGWLSSFHNPARVDTWYGTDIDFLVLDGFTVDARIHLAHSGNFDPYLQGGLGLYALSSEYFGLDSIGTGFQLGGGFDLWLSPSVTLGARVRYHGISMGPPDRRDDDLFISALSAEGSLGLHF